MNKTARIKRVDFPDLADYYESLKKMDSFRLAAVVHHVHSLAELGVPLEGVRNILGYLYEMNMITYNELEAHVKAYRSKLRCYKHPLDNEHFY